MRLFITIVGLVSRVLQLYGKKKFVSKYLVKLIASGISALILSLLGLISLAFSAFFLLRNMLFSPMAASSIIALVFFSLSLISLGCIYFMLKKKQEKPGHVESAFHAFMEGFHSSMEEEEKRKRH
jgi:hypothetical protein